VTAADPAGTPGAPRSELAFIVALTALVAFVYLGVTVSLAAPGAFDAGMRDTLMTALGGDPAQAVVEALNAIGSFEGGLVLTVALAGLLLGQRRPGPAGAVASTWLADGLSTVAKDLLQRPRPPGAVVDAALGESWSYPSGHVVRAMAIVAVLAWLASARWSWNQRTLLALGCALAAGFVMGIARIATGAHWPTDVLGGLLLGVVYVLFFALAAEAIAARQAVSRRSRAGERPPPPSPGPASA
jgi:membrane-associated phospholipid phosphatase